MEVTLFTDPHYVVAVVWVGVVVEALGGVEVFVVGKSGLSPLVFTALKSLFRLCASF